MDLPLPAARVGSRHAPGGAPARVRTTGDPAQRRGGIDRVRHQRVGDCRTQPGGAERVRRRRGESLHRGGTARRGFSLRGAPGRSNGANGDGRGGGECEQRDNSGGRLQPHERRDVVAPGSRCRRNRAGGRAARPVPPRSGRQGVRDSRARHGGRRRRGAAPTPAVARPFRRGLPSAAASDARKPLFGSFDVPGFIAGRVSSGLPVGRSGSHVGSDGHLRDTHGIGGRPRHLAVGPFVHGELGAAGRGFDQRAPLVQPFRRSTAQFGVTGPPRRGGSRPRRVAGHDRPGGRPERAARRRHAHQPP